MRGAFLILGIIFFAHSCAQSKKTVLFKISYSNKYCGGARPNPELLEKEKESYPLINSHVKLVVKSQNRKKKIHNLKLDENGVGKASLFEATYEIYLSKKFGKQMQKCNYNPNCSKSVLRSYGEFDLKNNLSDTLYFNFIFSCDPCDPMNGKKQ